MYRLAGLTDDVAAEESIDPAHDERVGDYHGHVVLHHAHHALHGIRIRHGVRGRLATALGGLEKGTGLVGRGQRVTARIEGPLRQHMVVAAHVDAV